VTSTAKKRKRKAKIPAGLKKAGYGKGTHFRTKGKSMKEFGY